MFRKAVVGALAATTFLSALAGARSRQDEGTGTSVIDQFPDSLRVEIFAPRAVESADVEYLVWISGASAADQSSVREWANAIVVVDRSWIAELFAAVRESASDFAREHIDPRPTKSSADSLEALMKRRDAQASALFARERELLVQALQSGGASASTAGAIAERTMEARSADAVPNLQMFSLHLVPNILHGLFGSAIDPRVDSETCSRVRDLALSYAPRVLALRRSTVADYIGAGYKAQKALVDDAAIASERHGGRSPASRVYAPICSSVSQIVGLNSEVIAAARTILPPQLATELEENLVLMTYGPIAVDLYDHQALSAFLVAMVDEDLRESAGELVAADERRQRELRSGFLESFDRAARAYLKNGLSVAPADALAFAEAIVRYHKASAASASETIAVLRTMAEDSPAWDDGAFARRLEGWNRVTNRRINDMIDFDIVPVLAPEPFRRAANERFGTSETAGEPRAPLGP